MMNCITKTNLTLKRLFNRGRANDDIDDRSRTIKSLNLVGSVIDHTIHLNCMPQVNIKVSIEHHQRKDKKNKTRLK